MDIDDELLSRSRSRLLISHTRHQPYSATEDVNYFAAMLLATNPAQSTTGSAGTSNILTDASNRLLKSTRRMSKSLMAFSKDKGEERRNYPIHLSDSLLQNQILVKSLSKCVQGIEKICNLQ